MDEQEEAVKEANDGYQVEEKDVDVDGQQDLGLAQSEQMEQAELHENFQEEVMQEGLMADEEQEVRENGQQEEDCFEKD